MSTHIEHPWHMVDESPWPLYASMRSLGLTSGLAFWFHSKNISLIILSLCVLILVAFTWWRDVNREATFQGLHSIMVVRGLKWGIVLFIISEVFFFLSFFWAFFHSRLSPNIELGSCWPPIGVQPFDPLGVPLLNTIILISSGVSVTWCHKAVELDSHSQSVNSLLITLFLGAYFTLFQAIEYFEATFSIADSVYGSTFFIATRFHGLHVIVGTLFLFVCMLRLNIGAYRRDHHFGLIGAI